MKKLLFTLFIPAIVQQAFAQYNTESTKSLGDKAFRNKDFYEAAYYYKKAASGLSLESQIAIPYQSSKKVKKVVNEKDKAYVIYQLADSYRSYENYTEATIWYKWIVEEVDMTPFPLARLWYGISLRATQNFDEAITQLQQFKTDFKGEQQYIALAEKEINNCKFAKEQYQHPALYDVVKKQGDWNSDGSDYAVIKKGNNYWFTSSRFDKEDKKHINRIYSAGDGSAKPTIIQLKDKTNSKDLEYGTPALNPAGNRLYFTRWFKEGTKILHAIYMTENTGGDWTEPEKLNYNVNAEGYNTIQPFITADGKKLYFASNKPGGQGGYDVWVSDLDDSGKPTGSINLGNTINTSSDEQAPYFDGSDSKLVYSSKGFIGLGGFDFYESMNTGGKWSTPENMGYPFNSAKDDLYYLPDDPKGNKIYISSDRESDCCLNIHEVYNKSFTLAGLITDCDTKKPLAGVKVTFIDSITKAEVKQQVTDERASYTFNITRKRSYAIRFEKAGYFSKTLPANTTGQMSNDTLYSPELCLQAFEVDKPIVIQNVLYDYDKATLRPESKEVLNGLVTIMTDNPKIKVELGAHTDSKGSDAYNNKLSQARAKSCVDYIISKGIDKDRIYAKGYGESKPIAPNTLPNGKDNPEGRQLNRRTEFKVVKVE